MVPHGVATSSPSRHDIALAAIARSPDSVHPSRRVRGDGSVVEQRLGNQPSREGGSEHRHEDHQGRTRIRTSLTRRPAHDVSGHGVRDPAADHEPEQQDGNYGGHGHHPVEQRFRWNRRHRPQPRRALLFYGTPARRFSSQGPRASRAATPVDAHHVGTLSPGGADADRCRARRPPHASGFGSEA